MDLWAFEDDLDLPEDSPKGRNEDSPRGPAKVIPSPRERQGGPAAPRESEERQVPKTPTGGEDRIRMNVNKLRNPSRPAGNTTSQATPERDFEELDNWDDTSVEPEIGELPRVIELELHESFISPKPMVEMPVPPEPVTVPDPEPEMEPVEVAPSVADTQDEFSPVQRENATPISLRPHLGLTKIERIGLIALVVMLIAAAVSFLAISLNRLPTETSGEHELDFPIQGKLVSVQSAITYWRKPVTTGSDADTVRRDTQLLPVIEVETTGGPAALRVLFRNDERTVIGDAVTRAVESGGTLKIPATAGFDDFGMHAAYRTGECPPWTIEVFEAPSVSAASDDFKKIFEIQISTDRR